jgi:vancomycin resistance protein YoaR
MNGMRETNFRDDQLPEKIFKALLLGFIFFCFVWISLITGYQILYWGRIYPGISISGINISGLTPDQAAAKLQQNFSFPQNGQIILQDGDKNWSVTPAQIGFTLNDTETALFAYQTGRKGNPINRIFSQVKTWVGGNKLAPVITFDQRLAQKYLTSLAQQINQPVIEASLIINGTDVTVKNGQVGREVDIQANIIRLAEQLNGLQNTTLRLIVNEKRPDVMDLSEQAQTARNILSAPLTLKITDPQPGDPGPWTFEPAEIARMIILKPIDTNTGKYYQVTLNPDFLRPYLTEIAPEVERSEENTRFIFNDQTKKLEVIQSAIVGRKLDIEKSIQTINEKIIKGEHIIPLEFTLTQPEISDDMTAEQLGIKELVGQQISYFYGSSEERIKNIQIAASRFHGLLVAPGETFSAAQAIGDVSLDNGYSEAMIIYGDQTIKGVGGGVCQVSTTLFRTAFFSGYPIVERYAHAYRVSYYEQTETGQINTELAGLDATVYFPLVDLKFTNDTPYWLLMETYFNGPARTLTWKFYSTSDGRIVEWETSGLLSTVPAPKPKYQENPDLETGEIKQIDWEAEGADIVVTRTVTREGQVLFKDTFRTHYLPWQAVYEYGPGTEGMPPPDEDQ